MVYEGGDGENSAGWEVPTLSDIAHPDIDAFSFNTVIPDDVFQNSDLVVPIFFSVKQKAAGIAKSGVKWQQDPGTDERWSAPDVFVVTTVEKVGDPVVPKYGNKWAIGGLESLGLLEGENDAFPDTDELNALSMSSLATIRVKKQDGTYDTTKICRTVFFSITGATTKPEDNETIWVYDAEQEEVYAYYENPFAAVVDIDALCVDDDDVRDNDGKLYFDFINDKMLFSVVEPWKCSSDPLRPCDILRVGLGNAAPTVWRDCQTIGLQGPGADCDDLDALAMVAGDQGPQIFTRADQNFDGVVDINDLFTVLSHWGDHCTCADVNDDGVVDINDIFAVLAAWGPCE